MVPGVYVGVGVGVWHQLNPYDQQLESLREVRLLLLSRIGCRARHSETVQYDTKSHFESLSIFSEKRLRLEYSGLLVLPLKSTQPPAQYRCTKPKVDAM